MALTAEQIEKQLKDTADAIEKGVKDINDKKASKQEVIDLITERTKADKELLTKSQTDIKELNTGIAEVTKTITDLKGQISNFRSAKLHIFEGGRYNGFFSSPNEAKAFALLVLTAATRGTKSEAKFDWAKKALEGMGIEHYLVDANGHKAMVGSSQTGGGSLVSVEQIPSIKMMFETYGVARSDFQVMPMGAGQTVMPKCDKLLDVTCPGEGNEIDDSDPKVPIIALTPKTLCALTTCSMELEEDSLVALGELLAGLFIRSFAYAEDRIGFLGDGTSTYFGFKGIVGALMAVDATISKIRSLIVGSGNAYSELVLGDFEKVPGILPDYADDGFAKWYVHRYFYWTVIVRLALSASTGSAQEILVGEATRQRGFLSYPVKFVQVMPKAEANSQIAALLANLKMGAILGTRGGIEFAQSSERYFEKGLIAVRGRNRVAINAHGVGDSTDVSDGNAGPICGLITAAA